jgi:hypothetical protein
MFSYIFNLFTLMRKLIYAGGVFIGVAVAALGVSVALAQPGNGNGPKSVSSHAVCPGPQSPGSAGCHARVVDDGAGKPIANTTPSGYGPAQLLGGYALGTGQAIGNPVIAIVDAYDDPNIKSDLDTYSRQYSLPVLPTCSGPVATATNKPCFQKVNQNGGTSYPRANAGWALEISLDVEIAHAVCQNCSILLVEATTNSFANLMAAVDQAHAQGATVISNSYGASEFSGETAYDSHFMLPGTAITFSSGDAGYGAQYPAASQYVTAVGGTTLNLSGNTYVSESAWSGAGSGCSAYETKPSWQSDSGCANRTVADVSAVADPATGAAVYDSVTYQGRKGWFVVGGTSLAAPLVAGVYALGGVPTASQANSLPYSGTTNLHDVVGGSNGTCSSLYLCTGIVGYDGPTGLGSPNGSGAF